MGDHLSRLEAAFKAKDDSAAVQALDDILVAFPDTPEKERNKVVKAVARAFSQNRRPGPEYDAIFLAAAVVLGDMGKPAYSPLTRALNSRVLKHRDFVRKTVAISIGKIAEAKGIKVLLGLLNSPDYDIISGAAEGLGYYEESTWAVRKGIIAPLINLYEGTATTASRPRETTAMRKLGVIQEPIIKTLQRLTGQTFYRAEDWRAWFNENKKRRNLP